MGGFGCCNGYEKLRLSSSWILVAICKLLDTNRTGDRQTVAHTQPACRKQPALPAQILSRRKSHSIRETAICHRYGVGLLREYPSVPPMAMIRRTRYCRRIDTKSWTTEITGPFLIFSNLLRRPTTKIRRWPPCNHPFNSDAIGNSRASSCYSAFRGIASQCCILDFSSAQVPNEHHHFLRSFIRVTSHVQNRWC